MRIYDEANTTNASLQPFKYNGKELDMMHGLNTYDYGARQYYSALPVWDRVDQLAEKDRGISPYVYCANNPVNKFDPDGLFPHEILKFHKAEVYRADYYTFTKPAAYLLGLVSGVDVKAIENIHIYERGLGRLYPWYRSNEGGGAITLGSNKYAASVTLTNNFFEDDHSSYDNHGYGQDINAWFGIMSHEVVHLSHIEQEGDIGKYLIGFAADYLKNGHDGAKREQEADLGTKSYYSFKSFVNKKYGKNALEKLFKSNENVNQQIRTLQMWWESYQESKKNN